MENAADRLEFWDSTSSAERTEILAVHPARHTKCRKVRHVYEKCVIRLKINAPLCTKNFLQFTDSMNFKGSRYSLWKSVQERVFQWKATRNNNSLHRKHHARFMRVSYITALKNVRKVPQFSCAQR
jgi:hypothetical protein